MSYVLKYNNQTFDGLKLNDSLTAGHNLQVENFDIKNSENQFMPTGFLCKSLGYTALGTDVAGVSSRGLYLFTPSNSAETGSIYLQGFSDGTLRYLKSDGTWTTIHTSTYTNNRREFETYGKDLYICNGQDPVQKWRPGVAATWNLKNKGGTATAIATTTLTFTTGSSDVAASGDVTASIKVGDWIKKAVGATNWYFVNNVVFDNPNSTVSIDGVTLVADNGAGSAGDSVKAADSDLRPRFIQQWRDRMFYVSNNAQALPLVGALIVGSGPGIL